MFVIEGESKDLKDEIKHRELIQTSKEQEILGLNYIIMKMRRELELKRTENKEAQTEVDMKNLDFIKKAESIYNSKMNDIKDFLKSLQKVKYGQSKQQPMPMKEIVDLVQLVFTKKQHLIA